MVNAQLLWLHSFVARLMKRIATSVSPRHHSRTCNNHHCQIRSTAIQVNCPSTNAVSLAALRLGNWVARKAEQLPFQRRIRSSGTLLSRILFASGKHLSVPMPQRIATGHHHANWRLKKERAMFIVFLSGCYTPLHQAGCWMGPCNTRERQHSSLVNIWRKPTTALQKLFVRTLRIASH